MPFQVNTLSYLSLLAFLGAVCLQPAEGLLEAGGIGQTELRLFLVILNSNFVAFLRQNVFPFARLPKSKLHAFLDSQVS
jgi:hypothetical protein